MDHSTLYDLSPLARLMLMGVVIAIGPLAWVWARRRQSSVASRLHALTVLTVFLTFDLIAFGAFTRLTDSGLGCPDWPGCYGRATPIGAHAEISAAQAAMPTGPVTHTKAWIEMIHRYLATGVGVLILTLAVTTWLHRQRVAVRWHWPALTLVWVCVQGAFGALTVTMKLFPAIVTLHLLGGMVLLALLQVQARQYVQAAEPAKLPAESDPRTGWLAMAVFAVLWVQIALGGWVSTNYAVLACREFPMCQGAWWPTMDFARGFELWRDLGRTGYGEYLPFEALTAIHMTHRLFAVLVFAGVGLLAWRLWKTDGWRRHGLWLAALAAWQLFTGLSNVVLGWPLAAALGHTAGAAGLVLVMTDLVFAMRSRRAVHHSTTLGQIAGVTR